MSKSSPVFVVTCPVPRGAAEHLRVEVTDHTATASTTGGFRHTFELPSEVAVEWLEWQVHADVLELRAPYAASGREGLGL
jgi:hypothetical protein